MKISRLLLSVAFFVAFAAVNGKNTNEESSMPVAKPTAAPLKTSTVPPTKAPKTNVTPTRPVAIKPTAKPNNAAKKPTHKSNDKKTEIKPTEKTPMVSQEKEMNMEAMPLKMPATVEPKTIMEAKPFAVTGFITQNGNVYEIEDNKGMGKIEGRQAEDNKEHVCNYGSVVIYSDVPCSEVTNVRVSGVQDLPALDEKPQKAETQKPETQKPETQELPMEMANNKEKASEDLENLEDVEPVKRRPNNKRRNKKKQQAQLQQQRRNKNRRNNNNKRRPSQQQQQQHLNRQTRRQQQLRRQQQNRRQIQNQRKRNQRRDQQKRRKQAQRLAEEEEEEEQQYYRRRGY